MRASLLEAVGRSRTYLPRSVHAMAVGNGQVYKQFGHDPVAAHAALNDLQSSVLWLNERSVGSREAFRELLAKRLV